LVHIIAAYFAVLKLDVIWPLRRLEDDFQGNISTSKYAKLAKCSNDTAPGDIQDLKERGLLIQNPWMERSTSYHTACGV